MIQKEFGVREATDEVFLLVKPEAVRRGLILDILRVFQAEAGLQFVKGEIIVAKESQVRKLYLPDPDWMRKLGMNRVETLADLNRRDPSCRSEMDHGRVVYERLIRYLSGKEVFPAILRGANAVDKAREKAGPTVPADAGNDTIRGRFSDDSKAKAEQENRAIENVIHVSDSPGNYLREREIFLAA